MKIELLPNETKIDTWVILYFPPNGGKYNGKLTITNKRLLYDAKFDVSAKGLLSEALFIKWDSEGYLEINKADIKKVQVEKNFLAKKAIVTLTDNSKHTFNYGALNVDKVAEAIMS
jgi:GRAM domain